MILKVLSQKSTVNAYKGNKTNTSETYSYEKDLMLPWEHVVTERLELRSSLGFSSSPHLVPAPPADCTSARIRYSHQLLDHNFILLMIIVIVIIVSTTCNYGTSPPKYWQPPFYDL